VIAAPEPDMSVVAEPKNIVAIGRWKNVAATLHAVEKVTRLPVELEPLVKHEIGDRDVAEVIKLDSSVDMAVALDPAAREPDFFFAFSIPLKSLDAARTIAEREGRVTQVRPGVFRVKRSGNMTCNIALSLGDAPARLVCGEKDRDLEALLPYLTRGMQAAQTGPSDIHLEVRFQPVRDQFRPLIDEAARRGPAMAAAFLTRDLGISDPAVLDLVNDVIGEASSLVDDLDAVSVDAALDAATPQATLRGAVKYKGAKSWTVRALTQRNDRAGAPPAIFWQAPKDSDSAIYGRGADPKMYEGIRRAIVTMVGAAGRGRMPDADRKAIEDVLAKMPLVDATTVSASGHVDGPKGAPKERKPQTVVRDAQAKLAQMVGWTLVGMDVKADADIEWLRELVKVYNRPTLQTWLKKQLRDDAKYLPVVKLVTPPGLPRGATGIEVSVPLDSRVLWNFVGSPDGEFKPHPQGAPTKGNVKMLLVVVPDGPSRTWAAFGADEKVLKDQLNAAKTGAPKEGTIAVREGLEPLRTGPHVSAGFLSLASAFSKMRDALSGSREGTAAQAAMAALPNQAKTPILLVHTGTAGATPTTEMEVRVQKGSLDDISAAVLWGLANRGRLREDVGGPVRMKPPVAPPPPVPPPARMKPPQKK
jgi:hypothetical protein